MQEKEYLPVREVQLIREYVKELVRHEVEPRIAIQRYTDEGNGTIQRRDDHAIPHVFIEVQHNIRTWRHGIDNIICKGGQIKLDDWRGNWTKNSELPVIPEGAFRTMYNLVENPEKIDIEKLKELVHDIRCSDVEWDKWERKYKSESDKSDIQR